MVSNDISGDGKVELSEYTESITNALMELAAELEIEWSRIYNKFIYYFKCSTHFII